MQVWFQQAVEAKQEISREWVDDMAAKGRGSSTWAFSYDSITSMHRVRQLTVREKWPALLFQGCQGIRIPLVMAM